jgi:hypothetical protein
MLSQCGTKLSGSVPELRVPRVNIYVRSVTETRQKVGRGEVPADVDEKVGTIRDISELRGRLPVEDIAICGNDGDPISQSESRGSLLQVSDAFQPALLDEVDVEPEPPQTEHPAEAYPGFPAVMRFVRNRPSHDTASSIGTGRRCIASHSLQYASRGLA